jgi:Na+/proline symporter
MFGAFLLLTLTCLSGLVAFAVYYDCDLLYTNKVQNGEQILPYLVLNLFKDLPGLSGLFIACVYSAALSTISAGLNSLSAVCIKDFIQPYSHKVRNDDRLSMILTKSICNNLIFVNFSTLKFKLYYLLSCSIWINYNWSC